MGTQGKKKPSQARAKKPPQGTTTHELLTHRITDKKTDLKKQPFVIRSVAFTAANEQTLADVKQDATDALGQTVSSSAVVRAVLRYVAQQPSSWSVKQLHPLIEAEIEAGRVWGTQSKKRKTTAQ